MTVVAIVNRQRDEQVLLEADRLATEEDLDIHVVYVLPLGWLSALEFTIVEGLGIPLGMDIVRQQCANIANMSAEAVIDDYEPIGLVGRPSNEVIKYAKRQAADYIVIDGRTNWKVDVISRIRDPMEELQSHPITVVPVY